MAISLRAFSDRVTTVLCIYLHGTVATTQSRFSANSLTVRGALPLSINLALKGPSLPEGRSNLESIIYQSPISRADVNCAELCITLMQNVDHQGAG